MSPSSVLFTALCAFLSWTTVAVAEEASNKWRLHDLEFEKSPIESPLRAAFYLHRSYDVSCLRNSTETCWELTMPATICSWGYYGKSEPETNWKSCWGYTNVPMGEAEVPKDVQQWLKWRITDFKELPASASSPNATFGGMKVQVVNGVPVKATPGAAVTEVTTFSTIFNVPQDMTNCSWFSDMRAKTGYSCGVKTQHPSYKCDPSYPSDCIYLENVTEEKITVAEFKKRYW